MRNGRDHTAPPAGLFDIPAATYHDDDVADVPTLSKSILHTLIDKSPAHAKAAHPKLNPQFVRQEEDKFDLGTVAHAMFLEGIAAVDIVPFDDWRTKAAQECRAAARDNGRIAMLHRHHAECAEMVDALRAQCDTHPDGPFFRDGTAEKTLVWTDDYGVVCRARLDWLKNDHQAIHDLKTTRASASPEAWSRTALGMAADLQLAFYVRGFEKVFGTRPDFRFVVVETVPPYAMSVFSLAPDAWALADKKIGYGLRLWAKCLRNGVWPAYDQRVAYIESPPWLEAAWLEREVREAA